MLSLAASLCWQASQWDGGSTMDLFWGRRSMHTLRKLPTARPRKANRTIKTISIGVYCGRISGLKSILTPMKSELLPGVSVVVACLPCSCEHLKGAPNFNASEIASSRFRRRAPRKDRQGDVVVSTYLPLRGAKPAEAIWRSEEHTSELQ